MNKGYSGFIGFVFYSVVSAIMFLLVYSFFFYPEMISEGYEVTRDKVVGVGNVISQDFKSDNVVSDNPDSQSSITLCRSEYKKYSKIGEDKYGVRYTLGTIKVINNPTEAEEFNQLYSGFGSGMIEVDKISVYPITAIASKSVNYLGETFPAISVCDDNNEMTQVSKDRLSLSG